MDSLLELAVIAAFGAALILFLWVYMRPRPVDPPAGDVEFCDYPDCAICKERRRRLRIRGFLILIVQTLLLGLGCDDPFSNNPDHSHDPWLQHKVTAWRVTPGGHTRDAGPFQSVIDGWVTEEEIDAATDAAYIRFADCFPEFGAVADFPFSINDDYVMWASAYTSGAYGQWAGGVEFSGFHHIGVCLWSRITTPDDPGPAFIVRTPGRDQWGGQHPDYRHTGKPLLPALTHEILHAYIGDPDHRRPEWARVR